MNTEEKERFVKKLLGAIEETVIEDISKMPVEWDGHELRQYIADLAVACCYRKMSKDRRADYNHDKSIMDNRLQKLEKRGGSE